MQIAFVDMGNLEKFKLLEDYAKNIGIKIKKVDVEESEDFAFGMILNESKNDEIGDKEEFLKYLKNAI